MMIRQFSSTFTSQFDFELLSVNTNFTCPNIITDIFSTAIKDSPEDLMYKQPFCLSEDFKDKVAFNDEIIFDSDDKHIVKSCQNLSQDFGEVLASNLSDEELR
ncbi:hypothetical protein RhiirA4_474305 [Rhizophagus irregularis]|uniref:Uncharacterized protein n=1 Tax=Rhizophagus irregularis TaxID=588596 RepID=A0A2I1H869_9GLOM|nr:hypothetical protein RhiirA4_474305 [Rhizophagus irregularis]